jgi:cell division protein FtsB
MAETTLERLRRALDTMSAHEAAMVAHAQLLHEEAAAKAAAAAEAQGARSGRES